LESPDHNWLAPILFGIPFCFIVAAQVYRYWRVSDAVERQQTKWVVFGLAVAIGGYFVLTIFTGLVPATRQPGALILVDSVSSLLFAFIPLSFGMAILRSHLWDIDILIRRTILFGVLTALLGGAYLGVVILLQGAFTVLTRLSGARATGAGHSELVTVLSTLVIAALFVPLRRRLQGAIDRRFYRRKYDSAKTLAAH
jgi:hypothetical protein